MLSSSSPSSSFFSSSSSSFFFFFFFFFFFLLDGDDFLGKVRLLLAQAVKDLRVQQRLEAFLRALLRRRPEERSKERRKKNQGEVSSTPLRASSPRSLGHLVIYPSFLPSRVICSRLFCGRLFFFFSSVFHSLASTFLFILSQVLFCSLIQLALSTSVSFSSPPNFFFFFFFSFFSCSRVWVERQGRTGPAGTPCAGRTSAASSPASPCLRSPAFTWQQQGKGETVTREQRQARQPRRKKEKKKRTKKKKKREKEKENATYR